METEKELCEGYDNGCGCGACMGKDYAPDEHRCTGIDDDLCGDCDPWQQ